MGKFCGKCGSELKNNKCPKCDKKETKKVTKKEEVKVEPVKEGKASFAWAVLGFFVPLAGLILFIIFINKRKSLAKNAGWGALIGAIKNIIIFIIYYVIAFLGFFGLFNYFTSNVLPEDIREVWDYNYNNNYDYDEDEDEDDEDFVDTIEVSDINTAETFSEMEYSINHFKNFDDKEYNFENNGITVVRNKEQVTIKDTDENKVLFTFDKVKKAYYHEFDCSGLDTIVIVTNDKAYYIKTDVHVKANIKAVEIKGNYKDFYYTYNHSYTCGGSIIALGKLEDGTFNDLNGEVGVDFDNLYYYEDPNNWISTNRNTKLNGGYGSVKAVVTSSVTSKIYGFIDSYGYAYSYVFDNQAVENNVLITKLSDSPVKSIEYNYSKETVTFIYENNETYTFDYAGFDY